MALDLATNVWPDDFLRTKPELFFFFFSSFVPSRAPWIKPLLFYTQTEPHLLFLTVLRPQPSSGWRGAANDWFQINHYHPQTHTVQELS